MLITISGIIYSIENQKSGVSKRGNNYNSFDLIIETYRSEKFAEFVCVGMFNKNEADFKVGTKVVINANISSNKYNGKYYTNIIARDFVVDNGVGKANDQTDAVRIGQSNERAKAEQKEGFVKQEQKQMQQEFEQNNGGGSDIDDLPFW